MEPSHLTEDRPGGDPPLEPELFTAFPDLDRPSLTALFKLGESRSVATDGVVIGPGLPAVGLMIVQHGSLMVELQGHRVYDAGAGSFLGAGALFGDPLSEWRVSALEASRLLVLARDPVMRYLTDHPSFGLQFTSALIRGGLARPAAINPLAAQSRALARLADECPSPILRVAADGTVSFANGPCAPLLAAWRTAVGGTLPAELQDEVQGSLDRGDACDIDVVAGPRTFQFTIMPVPEGGYANLYGRDITANRRNEAHIQHLATQDTITGLPNRASFMSRLARSLADASAPGAVMFLDLDYFKHINETLGHAVGDKLLHAVARRLQGTVRGTDLVARLGGDEFGIILPGMVDPGIAAAHAARIIDQLSRQYYIDDQMVSAGVSIGITFFPAHDNNAEALMKNADLAMYRAKEDGRNTYRFYAPHLEAELRERLELESDLKVALAENQFILHYQPKICLATGAVIGAEALVRWRHPRQGLVPPEKFIPAAERSGLIVPLGRWVLATACSEAGRWAQDGLPAVHVAVNLSPLQMRSPDLLPDIEAALESSGLDPGRLEIEITESLLMHDIEAAIVKLAQMRALGLSIAIDDFGTGYSCLNYLRRFPVNKIKIDRSFVQDMLENASGATVVRAIIGLGQSLDLAVVAEGIEQRGQADRLSLFNCTEGQGYFFARPLAGDRFAAFARTAPTWQAPPLGPGDAEAGERRA